MAPDTQHQVILDCLANGYRVVQLRGSAGNEYLVWSSRVDFVAFMNESGLSSTLRSANTQSRAEPTKD